MKGEIEQEQSLTLTDVCWLQRCLAKFKDLDIDHTCGLDFLFSHSHINIEKMDENNKQEPTLTEDLIVEILAKLSLRHLLQIRCVCKPWSTFYNNPKLIHMKKNSFSLMLIDTDELRLYSLDNGSLSSSLINGIDGHVKKLRCPIIPLNGELQNTNIVGSCNGLVFLYRQDSYFSMWNPCLWNPYTHEFKYLRQSGFYVNDKHYLPQPGLSDGNCILRRGHGFGYDAKNDDYKCVRIFYSEGRPEVHIYSFRLDTWKLIYISYFLICDFDESERAPNGVFCNGALHWFAEMCSTAAVLLAFDMTDERFRELPQPEVLDVEKFGHRKHVHVLDECICILYSNSWAYEVWVMKDYGIRESWTKVYNIPELTSILEAKTMVYLRKIECLKTGEVLLEVHYNYSHAAALVLYDPKNHMVTCLKRYEKFRDSNYNLRSVLFRYVKSLVKLDTDCYAQDNKKKDDRQLITSSIRDWVNKECIWDV